MLSKIKISISVTFFAVLIASLVYQYKEIPVNQIRQTISHEGTGIETDSLKRLETLSKSGSNWGMNPFGSGKPLTEEEKELEATSKHPNTEWPTRTISGVTYVFGEGNPKEVAPKPEDYPSYQDYFHDFSVKVITEENLLRFISNKNLGVFIKECGSILEPENNEYSSIAQNFPSSINDTDFSIEKFMYIDPKTRQKKLDVNRMLALQIAFSQVDDFGRCASGTTQENLVALKSEFLALVESYQNDTMEDAGVNNSPVNN